MLVHTIVSCTALIPGPLKPKENPQSRWQPGEGGGNDNTMRYLLTLLIKTMTILFILPMFLNSRQEIGLESFSVGRRMLWSTSFELPLQYTTWTTASQLPTLTAVDQVLGKMISPTRTALAAVVNKNTLFTYCMLVLITALCKVFGKHQCQKPGYFHSPFGKASLPIRFFRSAMWKSELAVFAMVVSTSVDKTISKQSKWKQWNVPSSRPLVSDNTQDIGQIKNNYLNSSRAIKPSVALRDLLLAVPLLVLGLGAQGAGKGLALPAAPAGCCWQAGPSWGRGELTNSVLFAVVCEPGTYSPNNEVTCHICTRPHVKKYGAKFC